MRRGHDTLSSICSSRDPMTGELHRRHHVTPNGYYKGEPVAVVNDDTDDDIEE